MLTVAERPFMLTFVPEPYQEDFVRAVLSFYKQHAQMVMWIPEQKETFPFIPNALDHIVFSNHYFYIVSCYCYEAGDPLAWKTLTSDHQPSIFGVREEFESLLTKYVNPDYRHLQERYAEDTLAVLNGHQMSYRLSKQPGAPIYNQAIVGVW